MYLLAVLGACEFRNVIYICTALQNTIYSYVDLSSLTTLVNCQGFVTKPCRTHIESEHIKIEIRTGARCLSWTVRSYIETLKFNATLN